MVEALLLCDDLPKSPYVVQEHKALAVTGLHSHGQPAQKEEVVEIRPGLRK